MRCWEIGHHPVLKVPVLAEPAADHVVPQRDYADRARHNNVNTDLPTNAIALHPLCRGAAHGPT